MPANATRLPTALLSVFFASMCFGLFASTLAAQGAEVCFSPDGGCTKVIVAKIGNAEKSVLVMAPTLKSSAIAQALVNAYKRGIRVAAIFDKKSRNVLHNNIDMIIRAGIPIVVDDSHKAMNSRVVIIDYKTIITGSFDFDEDSEKNAENMIIVNDKGLAESYTQNWQIHARHSRPDPGKPWRNKFRK